MKKRLLFINGHLKVGGGEKSLLDLLRHLDYEKYEVDLLLLEELGDYIKEVPPNVHVIFKDLTNTYGPVGSSLKCCMAKRDWLGFRMRLIFLAEKVFGRKILRLARPFLLDGAAYDCAIGYRPGICSDLAAYAVKAKKKLTWWHHGELNMNPAQLAEYAKSCKRLDHIVAVSDGCAEMLKQAIPALANQIAVVPNMVDVPVIQTKAELLQPYQQPVKHRFVTVGRLSPEKHVENAVYAAERLMQHGLTDFHWHIVGDGVERTKIEALIRDKQIEQVISLEGNQPNPYPYIKHATLYVHTSYVESQGLTILEAMALGVPCVVTRSLGPEGFIRNGKNGFLVEQNADSLVDAILTITQSPQIYTDLQKNTCCPPEFSCENVMTKVEGIINL